MVTLKDVGGVVGEYAGDGNGEANSSEYFEEVGNCSEADPPQSQPDHIEEQESTSECSTDHLPLLVLYDCEATGLSIYKDHLTDIAAKVFNPPIPLPASTFSSLIRTSRTISAPGNIMPHRKLCHFQ